MTNFNEGDDYWTIEDGEVVWSCWDDQSEEIHAENPNRPLFASEQQAKDVLNMIKNLFHTFIAEYDVDTESRGLDEFLKDNL